MFNIAVKLFLITPGNYINSLQLRILKQHQVEADVLRLDMVHPLVSGNKWFKLKGYIQDAKNLHKKIIVTFGGAYSNHIHATAAFCKEMGMNCAGIIRGEKPAFLSPTLSDAAHFGMQLYYTSREDYKLKKIPDAILRRQEDIYIINEGGYGREGMTGAQEILKLGSNDTYTHIGAAVGTGTTLAGLITSALPHQTIVGFSVLKNNFALHQDIINLTGPGYTFQINHQYSFGGYAKSSPQLLKFMNDFYTETAIPTDFVYTAKMFYGVQDLISQNFFPPHSKLLIIHSGGLQGNRSLPGGTLVF